MAASNKYRKQLLTSDKARQLHDNREKMEEEVRRLTDKVQILQAEVYSRQTEKARIEFNAARVQLKERKMHNHSRARLRVEWSGWDDLRTPSSAA